MQAKIASEYAEVAEEYANDGNFDFAVNKTALGIMVLASIPGRDTGSQEADAILKQIRELAADLGVIKFK